MGDPGFARFAPRVALRCENLGTMGFIRSRPHPDRRRRAGGQSFLLPLHRELSKTLRAIGNAVPLFSPNEPKIASNPVIPPITRALRCIRPPCANVAGDVTAAVSGTRVGYRADIDGLRALAVTVVILFHLDVSWLPGGFVGVDVFFVTSGFLITSLIARRIDAGSFSLIDFYERRFRRIYPNLIIVLAATAVLGWFAMMLET